MSANQYPDGSENGEPDGESRLFLDVYQPRLLALIGQVLGYLTDEETGELRYVHWSGKEILDSETPPAEMFDMLGLDKTAGPINLSIRANTRRLNHLPDLSSKIHSYTTLANLGFSGGDKRTAIIVPDPNVLLIFESGKAGREMERAEFKTFISWLDEKVLVGQKSFESQFYGQVDASEKRPWAFLQDRLTALCTDVQIDKELFDSGDVRCSLVSRAAAEGSQSSFYIYLEDGGKHDTLALEYDGAIGQCIDVEYSTELFDEAAVRQVRAIDDLAERKKALNDFLERYIDASFSAHEMEKSLGLTHPTLEILERFGVLLKRL